MIPKEISQRGGRSSGFGSEHSQSCAVSAKPDEADTYPAVISTGKENFIGAGYIDATGAEKLDEHTKHVQGAHYRFRCNGRRIGRINDFGPDLDRSQIIEAPVVAA